MGANAVMIFGIVLYFYGGDMPGLVYTLIALFFLVAKDLRDTIIKIWRNLSTKVHLLIFSGLVVVWAVIIIPKPRTIKYE
jgi:hypothetical protein